MKPKKVMWMSRHAPTKSQIVELNRLFPGHVLCVDPRPFSSADDIVARFRAEGADEMVVVAPLTVVRAIIRAGVRPILAEMQQVPCHEPGVEVRTAGRKTRCYRFVRFQYCDNITLEMRELKPPPPPGSTVHAVGCNCGFCKLGYTKNEEKENDHEVE